jgi:hypothetical protein
VAERDSSRERVGEFSGGEPLPCGVDRYRNPLLAGETPRAKRRYAVAAGVIIAGAALCLFWALIA